MSRTHAAGEAPHITDVKEQRVSSLFVSLLVGLSITMAPMLRLIPLSVLFGIFLDFRTEFITHFIMFANLYPSTSNTERQEYAKASLLTAVHGLNIFTEASIIRTKLEAMLTAANAIDGVSTTGQLSSILRSALNDFLIAARALLKQSLGGAYTQAESICAK